MIYSKKFILFRYKQTLACNDRIFCFIMSISFVKINKFMSVNFGMFATNMSSNIFLVSILSTNQTF